MKKMLLLSALVLPGSVFASEVSDGSDISCYDEDYQAIENYETVPAPKFIPIPVPPPAPMVEQNESKPLPVLPEVEPSKNNVFIATPKKPEQTKVVEVRAVAPDATDKKFLKIEEILIANKKNIVEAKRDKPVSNGLDKEFIQVKVYPADDYIRPKTADKTTPAKKDDVLASWTNDCLANARPNADCKIACCTPRNKVPMLRREAEWFKSFIIPTIEGLEEAKKAGVDVPEAVSVKKETASEASAKAPKTDPEEPALEQIAAPAPAPVEEVVVLAEGTKVDTSKAKPTAKKKVSLKKKTSWKKSSKKAKKTVKPTKKPELTEAQLGVLINDAIARMIAFPEIDIRLGGIADLAKYTPKAPASLKERAEQALIVFLDGRASIEPCPRFENDAKTDIENALALLTKIHNADKPIDLSNMNFSGIKIAGLSFKGFDLSDSAFVGSSINGADFSGAKLSGSDFSKANIKNSNFAFAELDLSYFVESKIANSNFSNAKINCSQLRNSNISKSKFDNAVMTSVLFTDAFVEDSSFVGTDLAKADMNSMTLKNNKFTNANLYGANLMKSVIDKDNFKGANFEKLYLKHTNMEQAQGVDVNMMFVAVADAKTKVPASIANAYSKAFVKDSENFSCPAKSCPTRLKGLEQSLDYILEVSFNVLDDDNQSVGHNNWALCNISCILNADASYGNEGLEKVASFVRRKAPWPPLSNHQTASTIPATDVQSALYVIGNRPESLEGRTVNLTKSDLRGADFYGYDMTGVNFQGSNLRGALTGESQGLPINTEYTVFAK